ncbi:MAG: copper resistance protein B [Spongiibacteraceae bacterium]
MSIINRSDCARITVFALALIAAPLVSAHEMPEFFSATRVEADVGKTGDQTIASWDIDGWMGSDLNRFAWKTEGDVEDGDTHDAEIQALYSRYIAPFWDFQIGVRHDVDPQSHNYATVGIRGLAPYGFDIDIAAFVRNDGKLFARTDVEYELLITNRFIVSPYVNADWATSSSEKDEIKGGLYSLEAGLNARYEFARTFAPYIEIARNENYGADENYTIARLGVRLLF